MLSTTAWRKQMVAVCEWWDQYEWYCVVACFWIFVFAEALFICLVQATVLSLLVGLKKQLVGDDAVSADEQVAVLVCFDSILLWLLNFAPGACVYYNNNQCQYRSECELPMQVAKHMRRWLEERVVHTLVAGSRSIAAHVSWYSCFCVCLCFFLCVSVCFCLCVCVCVCVCVSLSLMLLLLFLDHVSVHTHNHTLPHSHTILITWTCCYDLTKGTQDKDFSYSFSILSILSLMLYVVCCLLYVVWCLLSVVCCLVFVICCLLFVVCCLLYVVCCMLYVVYCLLYVVCCLLYVVCCLLYVVCCMLYVVCCLLYVVCCLLYVVCCLLYVSQPPCACRVCAVWAVCEWCTHIG